MLACVCQPAETALYKGGPPTEMGPLGTNMKKQYKAIRAPKPLPKPNHMYTYEETKECYITSAISPKLHKSPRTLLSLKKIEETAKSTKILVNPVCSDSLPSSDDSNHKKTGRWKGKKKRLKARPTIEDDSKSSDDKTYDSDTRSNATEDKVSTNCFKTACAELKVRTDPDRPGKDNCRNENSSNWMNAKTKDEPDLIKRPVRVKGEREVDSIEKDQMRVNKTDCSVPDGERQLGEGVELTLGELRAMALRQQQQIDTQHQLLCAKEQRLRYLKQQEARQHQVALEGERLRRLRERVEAQEVKLRKLRALRGHVDRNKQANAALTSDLESIRALFNEKEKELSVAVAKVEELTRQLEELRRGRPAALPPSAHELDKLRRELTYRNKLNEQQNGRLAAQRSALGARQEEMRSIDRRVSELQARLLRKRALNRQLAAAHRQGQRSTNPPSVHLSNYPQSNGGVNGHVKSQPRGNVAAVEPYNHVPHASSLAHNQNLQVLKQNAAQNTAPLKQLSQNDNINLAQHVMQQEAHYLQQKQLANPLYNPDKQINNQHYNGSYLQDQYLSQYPGALNHVQQGIGNPYPTPSDQKMIQDLVNKYADTPKMQYSPNSQKEPKINEQEFLPEFAASKSDPKYQTLPSNTKFPTNPGKKTDKLSTESVNEILKLAQNPNPTVPNVNHMTVHSTPLSVVNKSLATPLSQTESQMTYHPEQMAYQIQKSESTGKCNQDKENATYPHNSRLSQEKQVSKTQGKIDAKASVSSTSSNSSLTGGSVGFVKPVSSVAPTSVHVSGKPSPIYQTSSTKIQPVQPQTVQTQTISVQNTTHGSQTQIRNTASGLSSSGSNFGQSSSSQSILLSPPQSASTPLSTPDVSGSDKSTPKPALPPKPAVKTPPRQTAAIDAPHPDHCPPTLQSSDTSDNDTPNSQKEFSNGSGGNDMIIKARPLTIRKPPLSEQPKLKNVNSTTKNGISVSINRRIEMPPAFLFPEMDRINLEEPSEVQNGLQKSDKLNGNKSSRDELDKVSEEEAVVADIADQISSVDLNNQTSQATESVVRRSKKGNLKQGGKAPLTRRVSFDPLALLLDASLEGELELVKKTATQVQNASAANDEGITALHNAICAGHFEIVKFLVEIGCDVNAQDSDGWTPLHCAASCNNLPVVRFLVDNGACIFATTLSDHETAAEKCEEDEEGFDGCSEYLYSVQEKLGIMNGGAVYSVFAYSAQRPDELSFGVSERLQVLRKGDDHEREWWWGADNAGREGYVPRNLLGLYPRVNPPKQE